LVIHATKELMQRRTAHGTLFCVYIETSMRRARTPFNSWSIGLIYMSYRVEHVLQHHDLQAHRCFVALHPAVVVLVPHERLRRCSLCHFSLLHVHLSRQTLIWIIRSHTDYAHTFTLLYVAHTCMVQSTTEFLYSNFKTPP